MNVNKMASCADAIECIGRSLKHYMFYMSCREYIPRPEKEIDKYDVQKYCFEIRQYLDKMEDAIREGH